MRNKTFLPLAFAATLTVLTASCNKESAPAAAEIPENGQSSVELSITSAFPLTRETVADTEDEAKVSSVDYLIFKPDLEAGTYIIDTYVSVSGSPRTNLTMTQGSRRICAIVNPTRSYSDISTYADLLEEVTALKDQATDCFTMFGYLDTNVTASTNRITVPVARMVARIKIDQITNALVNSTLAAKTFTVTRLFLRRVPSQALFVNDLDSYTYYAVTGVGNSLSKTVGEVDATTEKASVNALIYKALDTPATVSHGSSYSTSHSFYTCPMPSSANRLSLIVEIKLDDQFYTYPVELQFAVERNVSYEITNLILGRPGNPSDGDDIITEDEARPIELVNVENANVNVQNWTLNLLGRNGEVEF